MADLIEAIENVTPEIMEDGSFPIVLKAEPGRITENLEALESWLDKQMEPYKHFELNENNLKEAKAIRTKLNKTKDQLESERKRLHAEYEKEYDDFFTRYKKALSSITVFIDNLSLSIKSAENEAKEARKKDLISFIQTEAKTNYGESLLIKMEKEEVLSWFIDPKWLLSSTTTTSVQLAVREKLARVQRDYDCILKDAPDAVAIAEYNKTGSLSAALEARRRIEEIRNAELETKKTEEAATPAPAQEAQPEQNPDGDFIFDGRTMTFVLPDAAKEENAKVVKLRPITLIGPKWALIFVRKMVYPALGIKVEKKEEGGEAR